MRARCRRTRSGMQEPPKAYHEESLFTPQRPPREATTRITEFSEI